MNTNASNTALVSTLADARVGTFTGLVVRKKGVERGPKGNKVRYGDDLVHVTLVTGFRYGSLVERSADALDAMTDADLDALVARGATGFVRVWKKSAKVGDLAAVCSSMGLDASGGKADLVARLDAVAPGGMVERPLTRADFDAAGGDRIEAGHKVSLAARVVQPHAGAGGAKVADLRTLLPHPDEAGVAESDEAVDDGVPRVAAPAHVDAALVVLHLLFSFKSLLALDRAAFKLVLVMNGQIVSLDFFGGEEGRVSYFAGLHEAFDAALVPEVRTAELVGLALR